MKTLAFLLPLLAAAQTAPPRPAPALTLQLPSGKAITPGDYKGKVILLAGLLTT